MRLELFDDEVVELTTRQVAELYWEWHTAAASDSRDQRLRVNRGDLSDGFRILDAAFAQDEYFDELVATVIELRLESDSSSNPQMATLAAGELEDRWNSGDHEFFSRLRARGIPQAILDELEAGIWKAEPHEAKARAKPRWGKR